mgnify:FL=1
MDLLKKFWENPLIKKLIIGTGIFLLIIIFLMIFVSCSSKGKIYSYNEIEKILIQKTKAAYGKGSNLPGLNQKIDISIEELVNKGLVKTINEYTQDETTSCSAKVTIYNNNGYYLYEPNINCGEKYKTKTLQETLIKDSLVETGNGLYKVDDEYIFKGDNVKNYIKLNDVLYRIVSINSDGSVRLMENKKNSESTMTTWDDRYNTDKQYNAGINNYSANGLNSRIKDKIHSIYEGSTYTDDVKAYFINKESCIGKRSINELENTGIYECAVKSESYPISILALYEYSRASLDPNCTGFVNSSCTNYNYFTSISNGFWTLTADKDTSYKAYKISGGSVMKSNASNPAYLLIVININGNTVINSEGNGSENNPYIINMGKTK